MPDYLLATLRSMAKSMVRSKSTAVVSDRAGERLTDDLMQRHDSGEAPPPSVAASSEAAAGDGFGRTVAAPPPQQAVPRQGQARGPRTADAV